MRAQNATRLSRGRPKHSWCDEQESVAKGFISGSLKTMFGGGPRISFGKTNPNLGESLALTSATIAPCLPCAKR